MICVNCRKEIPDGAAVCPQCGAVQKRTTQTPISNMGNNVNSGNQPVGQKAPYNKMCLIGLVISVISLFLNFWGIVGIAGVIVSVIGLINCKATNENGKMLAIIGIAIGAYSILYALVIMA